MTKKILNHLNTRKPKFLEDFGCVITNVDTEKGICEMDFEVPLHFCHSGDIIQGGFVTAMLDSVCTFSVFGTNPNVIKLATLELKVTYLKASRAGKFKAIGRIESMGRSIAFLTGALFNEEGQKTASITTTAKIKLKESGKSTTITS